MNEPSEGRFPVTIEAPVAWGEMDALGHVNNAVYFRWFESARIAYLDRIGFLGDVVGPILARTECRFRRPLHWPETVRIGARTLAVGPDRFTMEYRIVAVSTGEVAAEGTGEVVSYDYETGRKAPLPEAVRIAIEQLEGG